MNLDFDFMIKTSIKNLSAVAVLATTLSCVGASAERESTLRFPEDVVKSNPYVERNPEPNYHHASEVAYKAFRDMKYGVRIHWGLYTMVPGARESWTFLGMTDAERQAYLDLSRKWDPQGFNAEQWMQFFDRAGFRCFTITTKHHEGFSLFDTKTHVHQRPNYTTPTGIEIEDCNVAYSVMETPFKRDIVKELCDAAHRHNIKIDLYFSHSDWYDADFRPYGRHPLQVDASDAKSLEERQHRPAKIFPQPTAEEVARMMARHRQQLRELLTNYGKIDMVCLDIQLGASVWPQLREEIKELRKIQPDVMFRNRGIGNYGDYYTPERVVPGDKPASPMPWMVIYPLGTNFSYEADAAKHKGAKWVVENLVDTVAKGGNFMVGIGPDANGTFHPTAIAQLEEVGAWLKVNGEGVFGTHERPGQLWKEGNDIRFTQADDNKHVFAFFLKRPTGSVTLKSVTPATHSKVTLLGRAGDLSWMPTTEGVAIDFPADIQESLAYVVKIEPQM